jgi:hypothetical protein
MQRMEIQRYLSFANQKLTKAARRFDCALAVLANVPRLLGLKSDDRDA